MTITIILFVILYLLDQGLKYAVERGNVDTTIIPNFLNLKLTYNTGMAWGSFAGYTALLAVFSFLGTILLMWACKKNDWKFNKVRACSLTFALAGCVGNLYDRFMTTIGVRDGVIDMIDLQPFNKFCKFLGMKSAIFNLADAYLVVGIIVFAIDLVFFADRKKKKKDEFFNR